MAPIGNLAVGYAPQSMTWQQQASPAAAQSSSGGFDSLLGSTLNSVSGLYGSQNAAEAQNKGILAGISTQQQTMGNINNLFGTQVGTGNNAFTQLGKLQGVGGGAPDYSGFENTPGYQFAIQQGTQAINRAAAANGSLYTPNTLTNVGQYVTNTANSNYNNYVQQLLQTAGLGAQGNNTLSDANLKTGSNISQLQQNSGNAQASGVAGGSSAVGSLLQSLLGGQGQNGSGVLGALGSGISKLFGSSGANAGTSGGGANLSGIGNLLNGAGSLFGGGQNGQTPYSDYNPVTGSGNYTGNNLFDNFSANNGYDPTTGDYGSSQGSFDQFTGSQGGYDPSTGDWGSSTNLGNISLGDLGDSGNPW